MILKEDVEKVRAAADLYDIVSASVTLRPSGTGTFVGLCPFHDEKTPSFSVRPALGVWHCFGCGLGGDVFGYVEHQENIDFREAHRAFRVEAGQADRGQRGGSAFFHVADHEQGGSGRAQAARRTQFQPGGLRAFRLRVRASGVGQSGSLSCVQGVHAAGDA